MSVEFDGSTAAGTRCHLQILDPPTGADSIPDERPAGLSLIRRYQAETESYHDWLRLNPADVYSSLIHFGMVPDKAKEATSMQRSSRTEVEARPRQGTTHLILGVIRYKLQTTCAKLSIQYMCQALAAIVHTFCQCVSVSPFRQAAPLQQ